MGGGRGLFKCAHAEFKAETHVLAFNLAVAIFGQYWIIDF